MPGNSQQMAAQRWWEAPTWERRWTNFSDQALLTLDVDLTTSSELIFGLEEEPLGAWGQGGALYVDHQPREAEMVTESGTTSVWKLKLNPGWHWITWVWRYKGPQPEEQAADTGVVGQGSGLRLLNISVTHVRGGLSFRLHWCHFHSLQFSKSTLILSHPHKSHATSTTERCTQVLVQFCPAQVTTLEKSQVHLLVLVGDVHRTMAGDKMVPWSFLLV